MGRAEGVYSSPRRGRPKRVSAHDSLQQVPKEEEVEKEEQGRRWGAPKKAKLLASAMYIVRTIKVYFELLFEFILYIGLPCLVFTFL